MSSSEVLSAVCEIIQLEEQQDVNSYLKAGWTLLATHIRDRDENRKDEITVFTLGWTSDPSATVYPERVYDLRQR